MALLCPTYYLPDCTLARPRTTKPIREVRRNITHCALGRDRTLFRAHPIHKSVCKPRNSTRYAEPPFHPRTTTFAAPDDLSSHIGEDGIPGVAGGLATIQSLVSWFDAFIRFSRPHTIIGTVLSVISVSLMSLENLSDFGTRFMIGLVQAVLPALCMNVYIVGLNQLSDIEIDKINKPYLPLASGEFSVKQGIILVSSFAAMSLAMAAAVASPFLTLTIFMSMLLGTAYSIDVPFLRWKKVPFLAASCILAVRAIIVQVGFYFHMKFVFNRPYIMSQSVLFATTFMCLFSIVIALFKDIPDVAGDKKFGIKSFSVQLGQKSVYTFCLQILTLAYSGGIVFGLRSAFWWSRIITVTGHLIGMFLVLRMSKNDLSDHDSIYRDYMSVWKLFYAEYFLFPFIK